MHFCFFPSVVHCFWRLKPQQSVAVLLTLIHPAAGRISIMATNSRSRTMPAGLRPWTEPGATTTVPTNGTVLLLAALLLPAVSLEGTTRREAPISLRQTASVICASRTRADRG